jgi:hypothetical protein
VKRSSTVLSALLVLAGSSAWFVVSTITLDELPDAAVMASALCVALVFVSVFAGTPVREKLREAGRLGITQAVVGGVVAWFASFFLVISQRATDAPSGSETLFFSTAGWAVACVLLAFADKDRRPSLPQLAGAAAALLGVAAMLANWERPSSFSPFVKFPEQELLMLLAGVLFAVGSLLVVRAGRALGARSALWLALAGGTLAALLAAGVGGFGTIGTYTRLWPQLLLLGASLGSLAVGWTALVAREGLTRPAALLFLPALAVTALSVVERALGVYGPNPILWSAVGAGALLTVAGSAVVWALPRMAVIDSGDAGLRARLAWVGLWLGAVAIVGGTVALALPAFSAQVDAVLQSGGAFRASWTMLGFESAVGWLPIVSGLLAVAGALDALHTRLPARAALSALAGLVAVCTYPFLLSSALHTWNRWIPAEAQQSYGTEYARLTMNAVPDPVRISALIAAAVACLTLMVFVVRSKKPLQAAGTDTKENE